MELIRACGPQASVMLCGFKCHGPKRSLLRHENNQYAALISTASAAHISNTTLHDTQDTHMCMRVHFSSRFYAVTHENAHNFGNDSRKGEACMSGEEQTGCRHMVDSSTTDERDEPRGTRGDGETKTKRNVERKRKRQRSQAGKRKMSLTEPTN